MQKSSTASRLQTLHTRRSPASTQVINFLERVSTRSFRCNEKFNLVKAAPKRDLPRIFSGKLLLAFRRLLTTVGCRKGKRLSLILWAASSHLLHSTGFEWHNTTLLVQLDSSLLLTHCFPQLRGYAQKRLTKTVEEDASNREYYDEVSGGMWVCASRGLEVMMKKPGHILCMMGRKV